MNQQQLMQLGLAVGICYVAYRFMHNPVIKAAALGVGATIVARQIPIVGPALGNS